MLIEFSCRTYDRNTHGFEICAMIKIGFKASTLLCIPVVSEVLDASLKVMLAFRQLD
jgi:hypothetical protein